jgi:hypothetical protein
MALSFRLEESEGHLGWRDFKRSGAVEVTKEEAMIVAVAEIADALRNVAHQLHEFREASLDSAQKVAEAIKGRAS